MFKVVLNDGQTEMPDDDIYYIIAKEGVYLKKKLGVMESLAPVKNISILKSVMSSAQMHINPIPGKWVAKVMNFFREIYKEYRSEAIVLLFYNEETGKHKIVPPMQKVAGASCDYDKGITIDGYSMIGTIHSHGNMSAFHSGTDDADELHFDGLHMTFGDLDEDYPSISASIVANGFRQMIEPGEYIEDLVCMAETNPVDGKPVRTVYKWRGGKLIEDTEETTRYSYTWKKFDRRYDVMCSDRDRVFNKKWMGMVEKGAYTYKSYHAPAYQSRYGYAAHGYGWQGKQPWTDGWGDGWGDHFDSNAWTQAGRRLPPGAKTQTKGVPPQNVGVKVEPLKFPPHTQEGDFVPCATCAHRLCKLTSEIEEEDFEETYYCEDCGELVKEQEGIELICTTCKTDDHLILMSDGDLRNNYIPDDQYDHMFEGDATTEEIPESLYIKCKECGNGFHMYEDDAICPFCFSSAIESYTSEDDLAARESNDSGEFLSKETEDVNNAALEAAKEADKTIERIPEPGSKAMPIPEKRDNVLKAMFKSVFSKEKL